MVKPGKLLNVVSRLWFHILALGVLIKLRHVLSPSFGQIVFSSYALAAKAFDFLWR